MAMQYQLFNLQSPLIRSLILGAYAIAVCVGTAVAWELQKPVEFIIMAGPGGGADRMALHGPLDAKRH
jgi:tripartite-type tricarboxylate transporter receptor subunit TctC